MTDSASGSTHDDIRFALTVDAARRDDIVVERVVGREALSELFVYEVVVVSSVGAKGDLTDQLASDVSLAVLRDDAVVRTVHGILAEVQPDGASLADPTRRRTTLIIVPRLAELQGVKLSRTWKRSDDPAQGLTVREIVTTMLEGSTTKVDWRVDRDLEKHVLRTQFEETNFDFARRLLALEGIHFHFLHEPKATTVVFTNAPGKLAADLDAKLRPDLLFREVGAAVTGDQVRRLRREKRTRTDAVALTDFNFRRPSLDMVVTQPDTPSGPRRTVFEHPGEYLLPGDIAKARARRRLEELNDDELRFFGESNSPRLSAGCRFEVRGHKDASFNGTFVATHVVFHATGRGAAGAAGAAGADQPLVVEYRAVRAEIPLRPRTRAWPRPPIQTAMVVGPREGEPHVLAPGLVKVRFYWDIVEDPSEKGLSEEARNEARCAFARVGTDMAGPAFGSVMWPRVGMEVIVDFLNGKIDEPVVVRALYNVENPPPYELPGQETRSGFKSSTVGGEGHNEWFFEDKAGKELVFLRAQRDRQVVVGRNHSESVHGSQSVSVGGAQTESVGANQTITVGAVRTETVGADEWVTVTGCRTHTVKGHSESWSKSRLLSVAEKHDVHVGGTQRVKIGGEAHLCVDAGRHEMIHSVDELVVSGGNRIVTVHGDEYLNVDHLLRAVVPTVQVVANSEVHIDCGGTSIHLKGDGTVAISASKTVTIAKGDGSSVVLDAGGVTVTGAIIKLNC